MEWFLKSLFPYIEKDVSTSEVQNEEQAIFRAQQLDLIYAWSRLFYEIILDAPRSNFNPKFKHGPHVDDIIGSASAKPIGSITNQMNNLSIKQPTSRQATASSHPTQMMDVLSVQLSN